MTDGNDLLAAILANPADDNVRLVHADWLQEHGQETRAEFIRVQIELARLPEPEELTIFQYDGSTMCKACQRVRGGSGLCRYHELHNIERELWPAAVFSILDEVRPTKVIPDEMIVYKINERRDSSTKPEAYVSRGFISHITCTAADWLAHADAITREQPIERVTLTTMPEFRRIDSPHLLAFQLVGRRFAHQVPQGEHIPSFLLRAEWPRIKFELPRVDWSLVPMSHVVLPGQVINTGDLIHLADGTPAVVTNVSEASFEAIAGAILTNVMMQDSMPPALLDDENDGDDDAELDE